MAKKSKPKRKRLAKNGPATKHAKLLAKVAKADAKLSAAHRKVHPSYDSDVERFGQRVADYNAGWLAGHGYASKR